MIGCLPMNLMTPELEKLFKKLQKESNKEDPTLIAKFFNPSGIGSWFASEYDPKTRICYGFVDLLEQEWGYFSLDELEALKLPYGLEIEVDVLWRPKTFSEARIEA